MKCIFWFCNLYIYIFIYKHIQGVPKNVGIKSRILHYFCSWLAFEYLISKEYLEFVIRKACLSGHPVYYITYSIYLNIEPVNTPPPPLLYIETGPKAAKSEYLSYPSIFSFQQHNQEGTIRNYQVKLNKLKFYIFN